MLRQLSFVLLLTISLLALVYAQNCRDVNEELKPCNPLVLGNQTCDSTCANTQMCTSACSNSFGPGVACHCKEGFVRHGGLCIASSACPSPAVIGAPAPVPAPLFPGFPGFPGFGVAPAAPAAPVAPAFPGLGAAPAPAPAAFVIAPVAPAAPVAGVAPTGGVAPAVAPLSP